MRKGSKLGLTIMLSFFLAFIIFNISERKAEASSVVQPPVFSFSFNSRNVQDGDEIELTSPQGSLSITANPAWDNTATVDWSSSEIGVISVPANVHGNSIQLNRVGPGYSTIKAVITQGSSSYTISCMVKVDLNIDYSNDTNYRTPFTTGGKILVLDKDAVDTIKLKYVDYTPQGQIIAVSGSAIGAGYVNFSSDNIGVAKVDPNGKVQAVGSGNATITITSATMSASGKTMSTTVKVVVSPQFSITINSVTGGAITYNSLVDDSDPLAVVSGLPSTIFINCNASFATNLKWEIIDCSKPSNNNKIPVGNSSKVNDYSISATSGDVSLTGIKAGTYEIYAFADPQFTKTTYAPYAYMKIVVPIDLGNINITMNVGDTYNLLDNTNITGLGFFSRIDYVTGNPNIAGQNIAFLDESDYVIEAIGKGSVTLNVTYNNSLGIFDGTTVIPPFSIHINVIDGISLDYTSVNIYTKGTMRLRPHTTDNAPVTWTSSDNKIVTVNSGLITGIAEGNAVITASQVVNGVTKTATCQVAVKKTVTNIVLTPSTTTLAIGGSTTLKAIVTPSGSNINIQWRSSDDNIVQITDTTGLTAAISGVAGGTAVVTAINQDNIVVGSCLVYVRQPVTSIALSETQGVVKLTDKTLQIRAAVSPANAINKDVSWKSTDASIADVDQNGVVTFKKSGIVSIIATSVDNPSVQAICNLTIEVPVVSISLDETTKTMYVGQAARLTYAILPMNASNNLVTWTSTNPSVVAVDAAGKVTAKGVGTAIIILKTSEGGFSVFCTITVKLVATAVKLDVASLDLKTGEYYYLKAALTPKNATDTNLVWESSDTKIAIVDADGKVTGKNGGSAIIMVRTEAGGVAYCKVNVRQPVSSVMLNFSEKTIYVGQKFTLSASITPSTASNLAVTWKSSNDTIATISTSGEIVAKTGGVVVITSTTMDGGFTATCVITIKESVTTVTLDNDVLNLGVSKTFKLTATVSTDTATNQKVIWTTSDDKIAIVNQNGKVTGIRVGFATITATAADGSDVDATCEVRVVKPVESVTMSLISMSLYVGDTKKLTVTIAPKTATLKAAIWTSSDPTVAIVDDGGGVTALKAGKTFITATSQDSSGKKAICTVFVNDRLPSTGVMLQDKAVTMAPGETKVVNLVLIPSASTDSYTWSSDNKAVAKVDKLSGKITAVSTGTAYVTVMTDSGKTATVVVTVLGLNITEITIEQYTDFPTQLAVDGFTGTIKWSIDNPAIAVVTNGYVSGRAVGTTYITATVNGLKLRCKITVTKIGGTSYIKKK